MKFCPKCQKSVLENEFDAVVIDEFNHAIIITCSICNTKLTYKRVNYEENNTTAFTTPTEFPSPYFYLCEPGVFQRPRKESSQIDT